MKKHCTFEGLFTYNSTSIMSLTKKITLTAFTVIISLHFSAAVSANTLASNSFNTDTIPSSQKEKIIITPLGTNSAISGRVITPVGIGVPATSLNVTGSTTASTSSNNNSNYYFSLLNSGNYTVRASKYENSLNTSNGLTVLDALLIQAHILGKIPFTSPYKLIAADVNNDNDVSVLDIILLKRLILGIDSVFAGNRQWTFVDSSYHFTDSTNPFPYKDSISYKALSTNKINQTLIGIKLGDVNFDWQPQYVTSQKTDTLKIMAYNVLKYGDGCQGSTATLNTYLKTIIQYTLPDLLSCEKMSKFSPTATTTSSNFAMSIRDLVLNDAFPDKYDFATTTNLSGANNMAVLFYNKQKLGWIKTQTLVNNVTDFDLYKLYYKDDNLIYTHDTTFLYVLLNHTQSGNSSTTRDQQVTQEMQALRSKFANFPNLINMGDFNTSNSIEAGYQAVINSADTGTVMLDPPFGIDKNLKYPLDWGSNPQLCPNNLTTSTRSSGSIPNSCGTSGGAKSWYDHIFLSPWLANGTNYMQYIPGSYTTVGNDGKRINVDINSTSPATNSSAPNDVINALWQFSNKYPLTIQLKVTMNTSGKSLVDPLERN